MSLGKLLHRIMEQKRPNVVQLAKIHKNIFKAVVYTVNVKHKPVEKTFLQKTYKKTFVEKTFSQKNVKVVEAQFIIK